MRIWFDTEFVDDGNRITLISIGLVREDDRTLYIELETPETLRHVAVSDWVKTNVYPHLTGWVSARYVAAKMIQDFAGETPEFWAYVADYDWVALSQLYGPLTSRPRGWPWTAFDTFQLPDFERYVIEPTTPHNALDDALALKASFLAWEAAKKEKTHAV